MKKTIFLVILIFVLLIGMIIFSFKVNNKENSTTIKVAEVTHSIFYAPQYVAIEKGFFKDEGLDIELVLTNGADNVMAAVLSGDCEIGLSGSEATIYVYNKGAKDYVKTFAGLTKKDGSFIVSREKIDNFKLEDLKGKYILGGRLGGMPEMTLEYVLKENNIDPKQDLTIDTSVQFANMASTFIGGKGDFVTLFEPLATKIEKQGYGHKVALLGSLTGPVPYTAYNAKTSYINNNKDIIKKFDKAINKGLDFVHNSSSDEIAKTIKNQFPDTSYNDLKNSIESYKENDSWPKTTRISKKDFNHMEDIVIKAGQLNKKVPYKKLVYEK